MISEIEVKVSPNTVEVKMAATVMFAVAIHFGRHANSHVFSVSHTDLTLFSRSHGHMP